MLARVLFMLSDIEKSSIKSFILELRKNNKVPDIIPEHMADMIFHIGDVNPPDWNDPGRTAMAFAAIHGDVALVRELKALGANTNKVDGGYKTLLHVAALNGKLEVVDLALNIMTPEELKLTNYDGRNVFHFACKNGDPKVLSRLLQEPSLNLLIHQKDLFGNTPIDIAIMNGHDEAIHLLNPNINIAELKGYKRVPPSFSQTHLENQLTNYLKLKGIKESENIINRFGMCNGWSWLRQIYESQGKEEEYLALLTLISTWDGTQQGLANQDLPLILKKKYEKEFLGGRVIPGDVEFVFENFIHPLSIGFSNLMNVRELGLGLSQSDRIKQYELIKSPTDARILKNIFNVPFNNYTKSQLIEIFEFVSMYPGLSIDIVRRGHAVTLQVTPEGLFNFYDPGFKQKVIPLLSPQEFVEMTLKTDAGVDFELRAFKFYEPNAPIPEVELPVKEPHSSLANGFSELHLAVLQNNPQKVSKLLSENSQNLHKLDAHGQTPLKLALNANHPACVLSILSHNQAKPITHSDEIDFQKISMERYHCPLGTYPMNPQFDPNVISINECLLLMNLMKQGEIAFEFTDKNGNNLSTVLQKLSTEGKEDPRYKDLEEFIQSPKVLKRKQLILSQTEPIAKKPNIDPNATDKQTISSDKKKI